MKCSLIFLFSLFMVTVARSQTKYTIAGKVMDEKNNTIPAGSVYLLSGKDSSIVKYTLLADGRFTFDPIAAGEYIVRISAMGYNDDIRRMRVTGDINLQIGMKASATALNEVTVSAQKKDFSFSNGDVKINIAGSVFASIPNSVDMLSKLPMIQVSPNGESISVIGRGNALIYIDRQKATVNDLSTLSANDIQDVQIIRNPPVKYEAEGRALILITRKRDKRDGIQVELQETASFKRRYSNYSGMNLNFKKKKWELVNALKFNYVRVWESNEYDFRIKNQDIQTGYSLISTIDRPEYILNSGVHYQINTDDYISLNVNTKYQDVSFPIYTNSVLTTPAEQDHVFTTNKSTYPKRYYTASLNYEKKLKRVAADLFLGAQYAGYGEHFVTNIFNNYNNTESVYTEHRDQKYRVSVFGSRADFSKSFKNNLELEAGGNISTASANAILNIDDIPSSSHSSSDYLYDEANAAAYTQLGGKLKKLPFTIGARAEYTNVKGGYRNSETATVRKKYWQIFPKASLNIPLKNEKNLSLNYARSITRPGYLSLSQVSNYINPYFVWASNINIDPTTSNDISATFQWKNRSATISRYKRNNPIYPSFVYNPAATLLTRTDINYNGETGFMADVLVPFQYKKWTSTNQLFIIANKISDAAAVVGKTKPYLYFYSNNQFKLPKNVTFSLSGWALTKRSEGVFERNALFQVDTSVTKTFASRIDCTISWNDIFRSLKAKEEFTLNDINSRGLYYENVKEFSIAVRYSFGTTRESKYRNKNVDGNLNRL
ncbi:TonB-dependent receptor [Chitinophaga filiformis]|uniref:outer membrane beta-barrel family protein n=1 Tax=Chitinophaga filiformis TaxID=104663 RepID=UPI001F25BDDD|nr:outer membrane beta-barrel family protein [Chitinophaga filiformis]MCF6407493.1 TonB-dependent receptor [Chitinophaga filiformis]